MQEKENNQKTESKASIDLASEQPIVLPVIEEQLIVGSKIVESGKVLISKKVVEEESTVEGVVTNDEVIIERRQINQYVDAAPDPVRQEGDVTIISVVKEVLVIQKRLMLVEELHVKKVKNQRTVVQTETLRKEEITVSRSVSGTDFSDNQASNQ